MITGVSRCGAFPPVDGFCVGGDAVEETSDELGMGASAAGEAELPELSGGQWEWSIASSTA
jgi:hypothetical protein